MDAEHTDNPLAQRSLANKIVLLFLFCLSQFLGVFTISALFSAIPAIAVDTGLNNSESVWLNSAYQLAYAALLLVSGRMSDIYDAKYVFLSGVYLVGFFNLGTGLTRNKIVILVLRALCGIGAAMSIPSSLHLLVHTFPDPVAQAKAISVFVGSGSIGNVLGVIIGALLTSYATWPWVFFTSAIVALLIAVTCTFLIPPSRPRDEHNTLEKFKRLDLPGCSLLMAALVLFIFAVTSGSAQGWKTATVLVPLILSTVIFVLFFVWEARVPEEHASLPPRLWWYPNFTPLIILALLPYAWWGTTSLVLAWYWQEVQSWSAIKSGLHFLPLGLFTFPFMALAGVLQQKFEVKHILLGSLALMVAGTVLLPFASNASRYWSVVFPGFFLGTGGAIVTFATVSIAVFASTPPAMAGTVGAVFNCALQLGSAVITSVTTSLQTSIQPSPISFKGRAAAFEFLVGFVLLQAISVLFFVRKTGTPATSGAQMASAKTPSSGPDGALEEVIDV